MTNPEMLVLGGNLAGNALPGFVLALILGVGVHLFNIRAYTVLHGYTPGANAESTAIGNAFGAFLIPAILFCARVPLTIFIATSVLVASGFAFNEIFVHWFPNFAFAFIFLTALILVNLVPRRYTEWCQFVLVVVTIGSLALLGIAGMWTADGNVGASLLPTSVFSPEFSFTGILLFAGVDLIYLNSTSGRLRVIRQQAFWGLVGAGILFLIWGIAGIQILGTGPLMRSTIPHILLARAIGGEAGRFIVGVAIIAGAGAAVNALFMGVSRSATGWLLHRFGDEHRRSAVVGKSVIVCLGIIVAVMMALGVAGSEKLVIFVKSGLYLLLFFYAAIHVALFLIKREGAGRHPRLIHIAGSLAMAIPVILMLVYDPNIRVVLQYMGLVLMSGLGFAGLLAVLPVSGKGKRLF